MIRFCFMFESALKYPLLQRKYFFMFFMTFPTFVCQTYSQDHRNCNYNLHSSKCCPHQDRKEKTESNTRFSTLVSICLRNISQSQVMCWLPKHSLDFWQSTRAEGPSVLARMHCLKSKLCFGSKHIMRPRDIFLQSNICHGLGVHCWSTKHSLEMIENTIKAQSKRL